MSVTVEVTDAKLLVPVAVPLVIDAYDNDEKEVGDVLVTVTDDEDTNVPVPLEVLLTVWLVTVPKVLVDCTLVVPD